MLGTLVMIAGIILTIIYGAVVVLRRTRNTKHIDKMEKDLIGTTDESTVTVGSAHHSHAKGCNIPSLVEVTYGRASNRPPFVVSNIDQYCAGKSQKT